jgi:arylsulfatase A-like enzyme
VTAVCLVGVLLLARLLALAGRDLTWSIWLPSVLVWQDVAVGIAFAAGERLVRRRPFVWAAYALLVAWIALNAVVMRELSSPLTVPMLRAAGPALSDSIEHFVTSANVMLMVAVVAAGALLPRLLKPSRPTTVAIGLGLLVAIPGPFAAHSLDTRGAERNAVTALLTTAVPRLPSGADMAGVDLRASPFGAAPADDLSVLAGTAAGRNVVLIILESTGAQYLKSYGAPDDPMPALTSLAARAVQFDAAYAVYPESVKGLFAVLCSKAPAFDVSVHSHAEAPCSPLARAMATRGYRTALFHSGRFGYLGMEALIARHGFATREDAGAIGGQVESSFGVDEPATVTRMLAWIDEQDRRQPFFVVYMPVAGHHPYATAEPGPFAGEGELSAYKNALRDADAALDLFVDGLRSRALSEQTTLVIVGDHGEAFGQHDGNYGHTLFAYDENVRVPLLIAVPGVTNRPVRAPQTASVVDIAPTILQLAGIAPPADYQGASLLTGPSRLAFFYTDYALGWVGLRDGCWKYLLEIDADRSKLFDVCADPGETRDRAPERAVHVQLYRERSLAWLAASREALRRK